MKCPICDSDNFHAEMRRVKDFITREEEILMVCKDCGWSEWKEEAGRHA